MGQSYTSEWVHIKDQLPPDQIDLIVILKMSDCEGDIIRYTRMVYYNAQTKKYHDSFMDTELNGSEDDIVMWTRVPEIP